VHPKQSANTSLILQERDNSQNSSANETRY
jgi:hypothetical protein